MIEKINKAAAVISAVTTIIIFLKGEKNGN